MSTRERLSAAIARLEFSRKYTWRLLDDLNPEEWFWTPAQFTTHIAWQVAHLTVSQYRLCLERQRGRELGDESFMPLSFYEAFKVGSAPVAGATNNPPLDEIRQRFDMVFERSIAELSQRTDADVDVPTEPFHPAFQTKLAAVEWSAAHEMLHSGQIGMLRRLMGKPTLR
jgi:hypothetical protein